MSEPKIPAHRKQVQLRSAEPSTIVDEAPAKAKRQSKPRVKKATAPKQVPAASPDTPAQ